MGVVFAFSMTSQESANGTVFLGEACWTGLFPESGRGADGNCSLFAGRADYSNASQSVENPRVVVTVPLNNNSSRRCRHRHGAFKNSR